uniref:Uncharacterized protein n=1 Tax=Anguilla anguilla TaxID=7936 RepID=A0A0E9UZR5_ANGAN
MFQCARLLVTVPTWRKVKGAVSAAIILRGPVRSVSPPDSPSQPHTAYNIYASCE